MILSDCPPRIGAPAQRRPRNQSSHKVFEETRCRQHAERKGYDVAAVFPDTISGGGDFMARPGMKALLSFLDAQPQTRFVVIFDDLKRYARDVEFHLKLRREMDTRGALRECLNFNFDASPEGKFVETIMAAQGQLEREQNGRQVAQKMKARMQSGYWLHAAPAGYKYDTQPGHGKVLIFDEPLASIVREAFEGYASGRFATQAEVRRFLESQPAFPRNKKGQITQQRVSDILTNPLYTGHICSANYGINWLNGHHEALISIDTFEQVQNRRANPSNAPKRANVGDDFALRGIVACAGCGVPLRSSWAKGNTKRYPYYLCQTKDCDHYGKSIARDKIEGDVGDLLKSLEPSAGLFDLAKAMFRHAWDQRLAQAKNAQEIAKGQLSTFDKQIEGFLDRILEATNATVIATYEKKIGELEKQKAQCGELVAHNAEPTGSFDEKLEPVLAFLANPWKLWETGQTNLRRLVLKLAFPARIYYCRNEGARTPEIALPFKLLEGFADPKVCFGAGGGSRTHTGIRPTDFKSGMSTIPSRPQSTDFEQESIKDDADIGWSVQTKQSQDVGTVAQFPAQRVLPIPDRVLSPEFQEEFWGKVERSKRCWRDGRTPGLFNCMCASFLKRLIAPSSFLISCLISRKPTAKTT